MNILGLPAGKYRIRAVVNPSGFINETDTTNNTLTVWRTIPGTKAKNATKSVAAGAAKTFSITGVVLAPEIPARPTPTRARYAWTGAGYIWTTGAGVLDFAATNQPDHGTLQFISQSGLKGTYRYTPDPVSRAPTASILGHRRARADQRDRGRGHPERLVAANRPTIALTATALP